jgi:RND family efflux transporter MFP subunit
MKNKKFWALGLAVVSLVVAGGAWKAGWLQLPGLDAQAARTDAGARTGKDGDKKKPDVPLEFLAREVVRPVLARMPDSVTFSGPLVAPQTAVVRARSGGTLVSLSVAEGARVRVGQLLGRIELAELDTRVAERSAMLEAARATLAQAERTHAGNVALAAQQFISGSALDSSRAAVDTARANLQAAQASLETTRVGQRDASVLAPIAGIVAKRHALQGEKVSAEQNLLTIVDLARLELAGSVGTHQVARLQVGVPVLVQVEGMSEAVTGRLGRIAPAAEPGTRSIGVTIELDNPQERLRAGPYAMARVNLPDATDRLTLPAAAVGSTSGQDHVWLIENGKLARRAVQLGKRDDGAGTVEVLQGVTSSSQVLGARFDNLREGAPALVVGSTAAPRAAAAPVTAAASAPQAR